MLKRTSELSPRRFRELVSLYMSESKVDEYGHRAQADPVLVGYAYAKITRMSATRQAMVFEQADIIGLDIEMRKPAVKFNIIGWHGHSVVFEAPEDIDNRGLFMRFSGYYQEDR